MLFKRFVEFFITPKSVQKDETRRIFILNILLVGSILLSIISFSVSFFHYYFRTYKYYGNFPTTLLVFILFLSFLLFLSRTKKAKISATIFIAFLLVATISTSFRWGADVPIALLMYSLIIVMTGILIGTRTALIVTLIISLGLVTLSFLQMYKIYNPSVYWKTQSYNLGDVAIRVVILAIIGTVSWLFNRGSEKALERARKSEAALKKERDKLEVTVEKRTRELRQAQAEKMIQLYRLAEFGRSASGLFHDLASPLNLVSLNLNKLTKPKNYNKAFSSTEIALERAIIGTKKLENFVKAGRRQIQNEEINQVFSLIDEIHLAIQILDYRAKKAHIKILFKYLKNIKVLGNPLKFNQVITNLLSNAIDSYERSKKKTKRIEIRLQKINHLVKLEVQDWGSGISKDNLPHIFEPLFTTKGPEKGIGIGLSILNDIVEKDFKGKIEVETKERVGTTFSIEFPK